MTTSPKTLSLQYCQTITGWGYGLHLSYHLFNYSYTTITTYCLSTYFGQYTNNCHFTFWALSCHPYFSGNLKKNTYYVLIFSIMKALAYLSRTSHTFVDGELAPGGNYDWVSLCMMQDFTWGHFVCKSYLCNARIKVFTLKMHCTVLPVYNPMYNHIVLLVGCLNCTLLHTPYTISHYHPTHNPAYSATHL